MDDRLNDSEENPVASGLVALVAVAVVVGVLGGIGALVATRVLGIDGSSGLDGGQPGAGDTLFMPKPRHTAAADGPLITLAPTETPSGVPSQSPAQTLVQEPTDNGDPELSLTVGSTSVDAGEELMLSGTYVGGEGSVLDIYYSVDGSGWEEFPLDTNVSGGIFQTYVATWKTGRVEWRVVDEASHVRSNIVAVRIS